VGAKKVGKNLGVRVDYVTRVEGHGNIVVEVRDGALEACRFDVVEAPRFFEAILRGRSVFEAQHITSRICGICACAHSLTSIQAAEDALGVTPSAQTTLLRRLLLDLEFLDSHVLHVYLLALPDAVGAKSFLPLVATHEKVVRRALRMKKACNSLSDILVGRHVHPISAIVGGFTKIPSPQQLEGMRDALIGLRPDMEATVGLMATAKFPEFERETEYVALVSDDETYPLLAGDIGSTDGMRFAKKEYRLATNERVVPHSTAKHTHLSRESYAVGALARFNLNHAKLHPRAKEAARMLGLQAPCHNPYANTIAQVVEAVHCLEEAIGIVGELLERGIDQGEALVVGLNEQGRIPVRAGDGVGAIEAPRGILFHAYKTDGSGLIVDADCIIPTNQNLANLEGDMRSLVPEILHLADAEIQQRLEMLVRSYDPCISCSTHLVRL
jgi:coenzyme F420-reducing hydrogenase alpha subunit